MVKVTLNNKGFTLIEVLVTISIIALLCLIVTPNFIKIFNDEKDSISKEQIRAIEEACKLYVSDNHDAINLSCDNNVYQISLKDLKSYLTNNVIDVDSLESINLEDKYVKVTYDCLKNKYNYEYMKGDE